MDFSHLKKLEIKDKTATYVMDQIEGDPSLTVKPSTEANKPFFNELLRTNKRSVKAVAKGSVTTELIDSNRDNNKRLFSKYVVVGWSGVTDSEGKAVTFSQTNCLEFLEALPNWIFDDINRFCSDPTNFVEQVDIDIKN